MDSIHSKQKTQHLLYKDNGTQTPEKAGFGVCLQQPGCPSTLEGRFAGGKGEFAASDSGFYSAQLF